MKRFCLEEVVVVGSWRVYEFGDTERSSAWPLLHPTVVVQSQRGSEAIKVWAFGDTEVVRGQRGRCKSIMDTESRCHSKWLFLGGSMHANIDWHVCFSVFSQKIKKKREGTELILSVYQKLYPSVIESSSAPIVVVFVSGDWVVRAASWQLFMTLKIRYSNCSVPYCSDSSSAQRSGVPHVSCVSHSNAWRVRLIGLGLFLWNHSYFL